jgi:hypothetical protein
LLSLNGGGDVPNDPEWRRAESECAENLTILCGVAQFLDLSTLLFSEKRWKHFPSFTSVHLLPLPHSLDHLQNCSVPMFFRGLSFRAFPLLPVLVAL